jgi:hypothetical protein
MKPEATTSTSIRRASRILRRSLAMATFIFLTAAVAGRGQAPFVRTYIVDGGSSPTANGNALMIALSNISGNSATNPWLIKVEPGIFDLGSSGLTLKDYVDIEGSGPGVTTITSSQPRTPGNLATINVPVGVHAEVRELTVQNISSDAIGITSSSTNFALTRANVVIPNGAVSTFGILGTAATIARTSFQLTSSNNTSEAIYVSGNPAIKDVTIVIQNTSAVVLATGITITGGSPTIDNAVVTVSGAQSNYGAQLLQGSTTLISNSRFTVITSNSAGAADGIRAFGGACTLQDLTISVTGGGSNYGIVLNGLSGPAITSIVRRATISASGAANENNGVYVEGYQSATLRDLEVQASGGNQAVAVFAEYANFSGTGQSLVIMDSRLQASGGSFNDGINVSGFGNTLTIVRTSATASGGTSYGLSELDARNVFNIDHSQVSGGTGSVHLNDLFRAGASQLAGTVSPALGTCAACYSGSYAALSAACQ